ncbi:MAG TPA: DUF2723 domain-containing protein, partial [bacterium]|nr:DUF2723 domain-containing protein [bacterium]
MLAALIFIFFTVIFFATVSPDIMFEDSGEFAISSFTLGVGHPPGYPLHTLLGRLFQFLPAGNPGFRINVMSSFFGALGVAVLFLAARRFGFSTFASLIGAAACGASKALWSQSAIAEVYALNLFLNTVLLMCVAALPTAKRRLPIVIALLLGLTAANHYTTLAAFVPLVLFVIFRYEGFSPRSQSVRLAAGLFVALLAVMIYAQIPLRAAAEPLFDWRAPTTWSLFIEHVRRVQFSSWENQLGFHIPTIMKYVSSFIRNLPVEFFAGFLFIALLGVALLLTERLKTGLTLVWLFLVQSVGILLAIRFHSDDAGLSVVRVFYIGAYVVIGLFIAAGLDGLFTQISRSGAKYLRIPLALAAVVFLVIQVVKIYPINNFSSDNRFEKFDRDIFRFLPRDSIYYLYGTQFTAPAMYWNGVRGLRRDVTLVDSSGNLLRNEIKKVYGSVDWVNLDLAVNDLVEHYGKREKQGFSFPRTFDEGGPVTMQRGPLFFASDKIVCNPNGWRPGDY